MDAFKRTKRCADVITNIMSDEGFTKDLQFANEIGVERSLISKVKCQNQNASADLIVKIANRYPCVNTDYILMGRGSMFIDEETQTDINEDMIIKLQEELKEAYIEIGRLNMELKSAKEHNSLLKRG